MASKKFSNWSKNFGNSTKYAAANIVESIAPNTVKGIADTRVAANDLRASMKSGKGTVNQFTTDLVKTKLGQKADREYKAAVKALKTGNFAVKNSARPKKPSKSSITGLEDLDKLFDFDEDINVVGGDTTVISPNIMIEMNNDVTLEALRINSQIQSKATIQSANYVADAINNTMVSGFVKMNQQLINTNRYLANIDENIQSLIEFNNNNVASANMAMMDFMSEAKEYLDELKEAREDAKKAKEPTDFYDKRARQGQNLFTNGFSVNDYGKFVKRNVTNKTDSVKMMVDLFGFNPNKSDTPIVEQLFTKALTNILIPPGVQKNMKRLDKAIPSMLRTFFMGVGDRGGLLGDLFGIKSDKLDKVKLGNYHKGETPWDGESKKALTTVIPSQLNEIIALLSPAGSNRQKYFDYDKGIFYDADKLQEKYRKSIEEELEFATMGIANTLNESIEKMLVQAFDNEDMRTQMQENMQNAIADLFVTDTQARTKKGVKDVDYRNAGQLHQLLNGKYDQATIDSVIQFFGQVKSNQISELKQSRYELVNRLNERRDNISKGIGEDAVYSNLFLHGEDSTVLTNDIIKSMNIFDDVKDGQYKKDVKKYKQAGMSDEQARAEALKAKQLRDKANQIKTSLGISTTEKDYSQSKNPFYRLFDKVNKGANKAESTMADFVYGGKGNLSEKLTQFAVSKMMGSSLGNTRGFMDPDVDYSEYVRGNMNDLNENNIGKHIEELGAQVDPSNSKGEHPMSAMGKSFKSLVYGLYSTFLRPSYDKVFGENGVITKIYKSDPVKSIREKVTKFLVGEKGEDKVYKDGIFSGVANVFADGVDYLKYTFTGKGYTSRDGKSYANDPDNSVIGKITGGFGKVYQYTMDYLFGDGTEGSFKDNPFYQKTFGKLEGSISDLKNKYRKIEYGEDGKPVETTAENLSSGNTVKEAARTLKTKNNMSYSDRIEEFFFGDSDVSDEEKKKSILQKMKESLPTVALGGTLGAGLALSSGGNMGLILGSFLPGGPIGGAIVGAAGGMLLKNEKFQKMVFGDMDENGNRMGGMISKSMQDKFKGMLPVIVGGGAIGALKSVLFGGGLGSAGILGSTLLPGGPLGGAVLSVAGTMLWRSERFQEIMFGKQGEDGKRTGTKLSSALNSISAFMKKNANFVKGGLKGAALGGLSAGVIGQMGYMGAMLTPAGPLGGAILGLGMGIASQTDKFKRLLFGTEEYDDEGNMKGRTKNGLIHRLTNKLEVDIFTPLSNNMKYMVEDIAYFMKINVTNQFKLITGPIVDSFKNLKNVVDKGVENMFITISDGVTSVFKKAFEPITNTAINIFKKVSSGVFNATKIIGNIAGQVITSPLKLMAGASRSIFGGKKEREFRKEYRGNRRTAVLDSIKGSDNYFDGFMDTFFGKKGEDGKRGASEFFGFDNEYYINQRQNFADREGLTTNDWFMMPVENRRLKREWKQVRRDRKKDRAIHNLRSEFMNEDSYFAHDELDPATLKRRIKLLDKAGFDTSDIKTTADLNKWMFENKDFMNTRSATATANKMEREAKMAENSDETVSKLGLIHDVNMDTLNQVRRIGDILIDPSSLKGRSAAFMDADGTYDNDNPAEKEQVEIQKAGFMEATREIARMEAEEKEREKVQALAFQVKEASDAEKIAADTASGKETKTKSTGVMGWLGKIAGAVVGLKGLLPTIIGGGILAGISNTEFGKAAINWVAEGVKGLGSSLVNGLKDIIISKRTDAEGNYIEHSDLTETSVISAAAKSAARGTLTKELATSRGILKATGKGLYSVASHTPILGRFVKAGAGVAEAATDLAKVGTAAIKDSKFFKPNTVKVVMSGAKNVASEFLTKAKQVFTEAVSNPKLTKIISNSKVLSGIVDFVTATISKLIASGDSAVRTLAEVIRQRGGKLVSGSVEALPVVGWVIAAGTGIWDATTGALDASNLFGVSDDQVDGTMRVVSSVIKVLIGLSLPGAVLDVIATTVSVCLGFDWKQSLASKIYELIAGTEKAQTLKQNQQAFEDDWKSYNEANGTTMSKDAYNDMVNPTTWTKLKTGISNLNPFKKTITTTKAFTTPVSSYASGTSNASSGAVSSYAAGGSVGYGLGFSQNDSRWKDTVIGRNPDGSLSTMGTGGCGPTALANAYALATGKDISPGLVGKLASANGYITNGGANARLFTSGAKDLGVTSRKLGTADIEHQLKAGNPVIISGKSGDSSSLYSKIGHILTVKSVDDHGNATVLDPIDGQVKVRKLSSLLSGLTNAWAIGGKRGLTSASGAWDMSTMTPQMGVKANAIVPEGANPLGLFPVSSYAAASGAKPSSSATGTMFDSKKIELSDGTSWDAFNGSIYYNQGDSRWKSNKYGDSTIGKIGCIMSSLAMALSAMTGKAITPATVVSQWGNKYWVNGAGTSWDIMNAAASSLGLRSTQVGVDEARVALESGKPVLLFGKKNGGVYGSGGGTHAVLATGVRDNGNIRINDPGSKSKTNSWLSQGVPYSSIVNGFTRGYMFTTADGKGLTAPSGYTVVDESTDGNLWDAASNTASNAFDSVSNVLSGFSEKLKPFLNIFGNALSGILSGEGYKSIYDASGNLVGSSSGTTNAALASYNGTASTNGMWPGFGLLSAQFESSGNNAMVVKDNRGWAFGKHQWNSTGGLPHFMATMQKSYPAIYKKYFSNVSIGNPYEPNQAFKDAWKRAATGEDAKLFEEINDFGIYKDYFRDGIGPAAEKRYGISLNSLEYPYAVKEALLSTAIQHGVGGAKSIINKIPSITPEKEFLKQLYAGRTIKFPATASRYEKELASALSLVDGAVGYGDEEFRRIQKIANLQAAGYGNQIIGGDIKDTDKMIDDLIRGGRDSYDRYEFETVGFGGLPQGDDIVSRMPFGELISATKGSSSGVEEKLERLIKIMSEKSFSNTINIDRHNDIKLEGKGKSGSSQKPVIVNKTESAKKESKLMKRYQAIAARA